MNGLVSAGAIKSRIYRIRGKQVMLDRDLAALYDVPTFRLNEQVKRNQRRFPEDFMFCLTWEETASLTSQNAMLEKSGRGRHRKHPARAFTSLGVAMLSSVLNSDRAIQVNITIMRVFDRLRELLAKGSGLETLIAEHEQRLDGHDQDISALLETIPRLPAPEPDPKPIIGFTLPSEGKKRRRKKGIP
jgi:hypothetical protein